MPTGRGWAALGAAAALAVLWIGFGERELLVLSLFLGGGTLGGIVFVRSVAPRLAVTRRMAPAQVHEGDRAIVEVTIRALRPVRNLAIEDEVGGLGAARFAAAAVDPDQPLTARYEVLARPRGIYTVGPAQAVVNDPLGLAEARASIGRADRLVVYPAVEELEGYPVVRGHDPNVQTAKPAYHQQGGEDFFTLREYRPGDDLRRVHWPSTAKRDELLIRQLEVPWQSRALVLLDHRSRVFRSPDAFEHGVRGAASALRHLYRAGFSPALWTLDGATPARSRDAYAASMEKLATVALVGSVDLHSMVVRLRRRAAGGGALVMVTGTPDDEDVAAFRSLTRDFNRTVVLAVDETHEGATAPFRRAGAVTVVAAPGTPWAPVWRDAMELTWSTVTAG